MGPRQPHLVEPEGDETVSTFSGASVLLTGDSHMEWSQFGVQLAALLRAQGARVTNLSIGGSSARSWASGRPVCRPGESSGCLTVADLVARGPYDLAIVSLGTNDAANAHAAGANATNAARQTAERVATVAQQIGARRTWLVGPPRMGRTSGHYTDQTMAPVADAFASAFRGHPTIRFIDSRPVRRSDGDGIHVGRRGGEEWARFVLSQGGSLASAGGLGYPLIFGSATLAALGLVWWLSGRRRKLVAKHS